MLDFLASYAVPLNLILLMLIAGTEVTWEEFRAVRKVPLAVALGSAGQLLLLPMIAWLVIDLIKPQAIVVVGTLLLALCPGGGISNFYCYLARCNVLLSALITVIGTLLSLASIPLWIHQIGILKVVGSDIVTVPVSMIVGQLLSFMVLPMAAGALLRHLMPAQIIAGRSTLRTVSAIIISFILGLTLWSVSDRLASYAVDIVTTAVAFIFLAMIAGWFMGFGQSPSNRAVLVIESGVRNIGVALILGRTLFPQQDFALFASFLTGYFVAEIAIMLTYARWMAGRFQPGAGVART